MIGKKKSVVCHLLTEEMVWLDEAHTAKLRDAEANCSVDKTDHFFKELESMRFGFFSDHVVYVDKLRPINSFSQKKMWQDAPRINLAILHVTNECNLDCSFCKTSFCPVCKRFEDQQPPLTADQWKQILEQLARFGPSSVLITGGEPTCYPFIDELLSYSVSLGMPTSVHTNGLIPLNYSSPKLGVHITVSSPKNLDIILKNYNKIKSRVTLLVDDPLFEFVKAKTKGRWKMMRITYKEPFIKKEGLPKPNMDRFYARKLFDPCLNGKIAISYTGDVYPCLGSSEPLLNLNHKSLPQAVKMLIEEYWKQTVDSRENQLKCKECEFKYSCNACRFLNTDKNCGYNLEASSWI
ncbi:radical SAM protein [Paenibacillus zanthoxyli]|uniref:radical SAM protein n=1 Tax=Paenibacillus zanthoxyli TaxID=369399 RepID=UPI0004703496|nr:radical SAM protein [Paenibacillus zanthoxyli]